MNHPDSFLEDVIQMLSCNIQDLFFILNFIVEVGLSSELGIFLLGMFSRNYIKKINCYAMR